MKGNSYVPFMKRKGDGSTLSLDFTKMSALDSRFTFTRSTTATYINSSGYVATMAAAATNDPTKARFDYNPTTLAPNGLLIEGQTTNLTKRSDNAFTNSYWETTSSNVDAADSAVTSPTGVASTASTLTERYALGASVSRHIHQLTGEFTPTVATSYTMSAWVKQPASAAIRYVQLAFWTAGFGANAYMNYDIQAGTVGTGGAAISASTITAYPSGWYRITATAPATATGSSGFQLGFSTTSGAVRTETYTVTAGSEKAIYLWGAQVEAGVGASSYIPTVASQVTRALDSCIMSGTSFSSWFNATQGTLLTTWSSTSIPSGRYATINDGSTSNQIWTGYSESAIYNGSFQASFGTATTANGKVAIAYALNDAAWCLSGGTVSTDTSVTLPTGLNQVTFGANSAGGAQVNTSLKTIKFFPTRLSSAQLIAMTT